MVMTLLLLTSGCSKYDDSALKGRVDNLESRVVRLEELCKQMNTNISSLQPRVEAVQGYDYVTDITRMVKRLAILSTLPRVLR